MAAEIKIEEFKQMKIANLPGGSTALIKFDEKDVKGALISFDNGANWVSLVAAKAAICSFVDRHLDEIEF
jgi:hypothetical protein